MTSPREIQSDYYKRTARNYEALHVCEDDEHYFALWWLSSLIAQNKIQSVLDVGSGTGRAVRFLKEKYPALRITGIEPVAQLRQVGFEMGLASNDLVEGDALSLPYADGSFDIVCEFGALHHIKTPDKAVSEMLRVASKAIFISDSNTFGQGSWLPRKIKQAAWRLGLWNVFAIAQSRGKGYLYSEGDGVFYNYSVFCDLAIIKRGCISVHVCNTVGSSAASHFDEASHIALFGVKK